MDKNTLPKVSIITPSFNQVQTIEATIQSVLEQGYPNLEYVIIDGGSTDGSVEVIEKYASQLTYWETKPDKGVYDAMNKGIERVSGEWVYFLGTDDLLTPGILNALFCNEEYKTKISDVSFLYGTVILTSTQQEYGRAFNKQDIVELPICHQALFVQKKLFKQVGRFELLYKVSADHVFMIKCFGNEKIQKLHVPLPIATYNNESGLSSREKDIFFYLNRPRLVQRYLNISIPPPRDLSPHKGYQYIRKRKFRQGITYLWLCGFYTKNYFSYFKNGLFWLKEAMKGQN